MMFLDFMGQEIVNADKIILALNMIQNVEIEIITDVLQDIHLQIFVKKIQLHHVVM